MSELSSVEALLRRALMALPDYRNDVILVGGLVPYRRLPGMRIPEHPAIATTEADLSIRRPLPVIEHTIPDLLRAAGLGIYQAPSLDPRRPRQQRFQDVAYGTLRSAPVYIEFLTPLRGKPVEGLVEPHPGVLAPALRYLDILAFDTISVDLDEGCTVRIPHPTTFVIQKVLARGAGRAATKQPKDMAYIYDAALLSQPSWADYQGIVERLRNESPEWLVWLDRALRELDILFKDGSASGAIEASSVLHAATGLKVSAAEISRVVQRFCATALAR